MSVDKNVASAAPRGSAPYDSIDRRGWIALLAIGFGVSVVIMDATIVNVALPVVLEKLHLTAADAQWINASYSLVFAALLLTVGRIGDLHGRRKVFAVGLVVFMAASVVAGLSRRRDAHRRAAGPGARSGDGRPVTLSTLNAMFTGRARGIAFAVWGSAIGGMAAIGPLIGGWLATDASWRWAFWLNIPVGLLVLLGIVKAVPETRVPRRSPVATPSASVLSAVGMGGIVFALIESQWFGWWRQGSGALSPVPVALSAASLLMVAFVVVERRRAAAGQYVLIDLGLFRLRTFRAGVVAALIVAFGEFGLLFTLPLLLQGTLGYTALGTGGIIVVLALGTFLISGMLPADQYQRLSQRTIVQIGLPRGRRRRRHRARRVADVSTWACRRVLFVYGVGVGMATAQLTSLLLPDVPPDESGQASGLQSSIRQLGSASGVAALGGLLIARLARRLATTSPPFASRRRPSTGSPMP